MGRNSPIFSWLLFQKPPKESSWTAAESVCQTFGGDLTPLLDTHEKDFVYQQVINRRSYDYYWIGLNDLHQPGRYQWVTTDGSDEPKVCTIFQV